MQIMDWKCSDLLFGADMEEFRVEKTVKTDKSLDEIEKLCVDESLNELEKIFLLLGSSFDVQKVWAVDHIVPLLRKQGNSSLLMKLLPKVKSILKPPVSVEIHAAVSRCFIDIAKDPSLQIVSFTTHFFPIVLSEFENSNNITSDIWLECLVTSIQAASKDVIKHKVLNIIRSKCQLSQSIQARQSSCIIIGSVATKMEPYWIKQELLPLVRSLCQDVDQEVRIKMCPELSKIARTLGADTTKVYLLPEIEELLKDDQVDVRCAALSALYELVPLVDEGCQKSFMIPVLIRFLEEATGRKAKCGLRERENQENNMKLHAASLMGRLCFDLKDLYTKDNVNTLLDIYTDLSNTETVSAQLIPTKTQAQSTTGEKVSSSPLVPVDADNDCGTECRRMCAYNIPGMILFSSSVNKVDAVLPVFKSLSNDSNLKVRVAVANGYHEVIKHLGNESKSFMKDYAAFLKDANPEVLSGLVKGLPNVLEVFTRAFKLDSKTRQPGLIELIQPLLAAEQVASKYQQWRLHKNLLDVFCHLRHCMTSEQLYTNFIPLLWRCIGNSKRPITDLGSTMYVLPVKRAACRTMCIYISSIRKAEQRREICSKFISECAQSNSYKQKLLFIEVCQMILDMFSRNFFKENGFFTALLLLSKDPTVNVRHRLCDMLPQLKSVILLPVDREYQTLLESAIGDLLMDRHSECLNGIRQAVKQMDKISYRMQSMVAYTLEGDVMDKEREDNEKQLLKEEEEWEKEKERENSNHRLHGDTRKSAPVIRNGDRSPIVTKKRMNTTLGVKSQTHQHLSPGMSRKGNLQGPSAVNSPGPSSKPGRAGSGSTQDSTKKTFDLSPDTTGRSNSSGNKSRYATGSVPNLIVSNASPKGIKASKPSSPNSSIKQSPLGQQKGQGSVSQSTKTKRVPSSK